MPLEQRRKCICWGFILPQTTFDVQAGVCHSMTFLLDRLKITLSGHLNGFKIPFFARVTVWFVMCATQY